VIDFKGAIFRCFELERGGMAAPEKEKREQAPALQTWLSTASIIVRL
jgi:hypothetical protein